ncbi:MAG: OmpA family protein [Alphaproteobacteria bacterium]|nr:OmpA family protein [Alphaproteobacteria bacterium]
MADEQALKPTIIKKRIKPKENPHGGAWKVAFADFVTAMMAFFLLLWLLNATTDSQKQGISELFEPDSFTDGDDAGAGQALKGLALTAEGALKSSGSPPSASIPIPSFGGQHELVGKAEEARTSSDENPDSTNVEARRRQTEEFERAKSSLRLALEKNPELREFQENLLIENTPEGMRIQLVDQERISMFKPGGAVMSAYSEAFLELITTILVKFPNQIVITGHTNASSLENTKFPSNWELSGERANAARRVIVEAGLPEGRINAIAGKADSEHLYPQEPNSPRNRRITILLVRPTEEQRAAQ